MDFSDKYQVAAFLGTVIDGGVVVEIGCGDGRTTRAISSGMSSHRTLPIYALDDYGDRPEAKAAFMERVEDIKHRVILIDFQESVEEKYLELCAQSCVKCGEAKRPLPKRETYVA